MSITLELNKQTECFIKKQANKNKLSITEYFIELANKESNKQDIKKDIIEAIQELNLVKKGKLKTNPINNLFNA